MSLAKISTNKNNNLLDASVKNFAEVEYQKEISNEEDFDLIVLYGGLRELFYFTDSQYEEHCLVNKFKKKPKRLLINSHLEGGFNIPARTLQKTLNFYQNELHIKTFIATQNEKFCKLSPNIKYLHRWWLSPKFFKDKVSLTNNPYYKFNYIIGQPRPDKLEFSKLLFKNRLLGRNISAWLSAEKGQRTQSVIDNSKNSLDGYPYIYNKVFPDKDARHLSLDEILKDVPDAYKDSKNIMAINLLYCILNSRFSLIQETEMGQVSNRYTEKTLKPMEVGQPFLIAGNYKSLDLLRRDGFKTFHPHINEEYDNIKNKNIRSLAIIEEVKRLCSLTEKEWLILVEKISDRLDHNKKHLKVIHNKYVCEYNNIVSSLLSDNLV
jgi:hypothetical protein